MAAVGGGDADGGVKLGHRTGAQRGTLRPAQHARSRGHALRPYDTRPAGQQKGGGRRSHWNEYVGTEKLNSGVLDTDKVRSATNVASYVVLNKNFRCFHNPRANVLHASPFEHIAVASTELAPVVRQRSS
jgi:hypothetical protein